MKPIRVFISYSHKDEQFRKELSSHLKLLERLNVLSTWHDRRIPAGAKWKAQIDSHLDEADVILCLVSAYFFESDYCWEKEMKRALVRHERGEAIVIPIIVRPVAWHDSPLAALQALPPEAKPVEEWEHSAQAWVAVVQGLMEASEGIFGVRERTHNAARESSTVIDPSVRALLDSFGVADWEQPPHDEAIAAGDLIVLRMRDARAEELIANYRRASTSHDWLRAQTDTLGSKLSKVNAMLGVVVMMAFLAELQRRKLQTYVAEAEALLWFEDAAVRAGPATRELLDPARYGLDRSLVAVSGEIACAMPKYSQLLRTVVAQIQVLTEVFREGFEKAFGKDAWDEIYGKNKS